MSYWAKTYVWDDTSAVAVDKNGDIVVATTLGKVTRLDSNGNVKWLRTYSLGELYDEMFQDVKFSPDGNIVAVGGENNSAFVVKLSPEGDVIWAKTYGGSKDDVALAAAIAPDGNIIVAGYTNSFGAGGKDAWVLRLDSEGNVIWQKTYGGDKRIEAVALAPNEDIIVAGGTWDLLVLRLDENGNVRWQKTYGGKDRDGARSVAIAPNGDIVVAGYTESFGAGGTYVWVLRLPPDGELTGFSRDSKAEVKDSKAEVHDTNVEGVEGKKVEMVEVEKEVWVEETVPVQKEAWVTEGKLFKRKVKKTITVQEKRRVKKKIKTPEERVVERVKIKELDGKPQEIHPTIMVQYDSTVKAFIEYWNALSKGDLKKAAETLEKLSKLKHFDPHLILPLIEFKAFVDETDEDEKDAIVYLENHARMEIKCKVETSSLVFTAQPIELTLKPGKSITKTMRVKRKDKDRKWKNLELRLSLSKWGGKIDRKVEVLEDKDYKCLLALQENSPIRRFKLLREAIEEGSEKAKSELESLIGELKSRLAILEESVFLSVEQLVEGKTSTANLAITNPFNFDVPVKCTLGFTGGVKPEEFEVAIPAGGEKKVRLELTPKTYGSSELKLHMNVKGITEIEKVFQLNVQEHPVRSNLPKIIDVIIPQLVEDVESPVKITVTNTLADSLKLTLDFSANEFLELETETLEFPELRMGQKVSKTLAVTPKYAGNFDFRVKIKAIADGIEVEDEKVIPVDVVEKTAQPYATPQTPATQDTPSSQPITPSPAGLQLLAGFPPQLAYKYTDVEFIGKGGFARVYKAKRRDGKVVAVKIPLSLDENTGKAFLREITNWLHLKHPNIVHLYDANVLPIPFLEMEYCESSLEKLPKPMKPREAALLIFNIAEGLKYAHSKGIIHRDLKPSNILIKDSTPKISDWGLSKVVTETHTTTPVSYTPHYAAPEQISRRFGRPDHRSDIWQLGVIFYELVTGRRPFEGDGLVEIASRITMDEPLPPSELNPEVREVEPIIMACLEKDMEKRYHSAAELQFELATYLGISYKEELKRSLSANNTSQAAFYAGQLMLVFLKMGNLKDAYKYASDLRFYTHGGLTSEVEALAEQIRVRLEEDLSVVGEELLAKAEIIAHKVSLGFREV